MSLNKWYTFAAMTVLGTGCVSQDEYLRRSNGQDFFNEAYTRAPETVASITQICEQKADQQLKSSVNQNNSACQEKVDELAHRLNLHGCYVQSILHVTGAINGTMGDLNTLTKIAQEKQPEGLLNAEKKAFCGQISDLATACNEARQNPTLINWNKKFGCGLDF